MRLSTKVARLKKIKRPNPEKLKKAK